MNTQKQQEDADRADPDVSVSESGRGNGRDIEKRLSVLETHFKYLATKEEIQKLKVWCLRGVIIGTITAVTLAIGLLKLFP